MSRKQDILELISKEKYQEASELCEEAIEAHPEDIHCYFYLGLVYLLQEEIEEAQGVWMCAMLECPSDLNGDERNNLLIEILQTQAQNETEQENWHNSQLIYEQLQELVPDDINTLLTLVKTSLQAGELTPQQLEEWQVEKQLQQLPPGKANPDLILEIFQLALSFPVPGIEPLIASAFEHVENTPQLIELENQNIETLIVLAVTAYGTGKHEASVNLLKRVIKVNPDLPQVYSNLGNARKELGNLDQAKENYEKAIELDPNFAEVYHNLGNLYRDQGKFDTAKTYYQQALKLNSQLEKTYINLGLLERDAGNREQAIDYHNKLLALYPNHAEGYNNLGLLQSEEGNYEEAEASLKYSIQLKPEYADAYNNLGLLCQSQGRDEEAASYYQIAINCYQKAKAKKTDFVKANHNLGLLFYDIGELEKAKTYYKKALAINPNYPEALNNLGLVYKEKQKINLAIKYFNKALEINPNMVIAYSNLGNTFRQKGDFETAVDYYNRGFQIDPNSAHLYYSFSEIHKYQKEGDPYFDNLLALRENKEIIYTNRKYIEFALAKAWRDIGNYEEEIACLNQGNAMKREEINYSIDKDLERFDDIKQKFNSDTLSKFDSIFEPTRIPIFILGMPRSGTTLTEQILSSHSQVAGLGELPYLFQTVKTNKNLFENLPKITKEELIEARNQYLEQVAQHNDDSPYFTDKMPYNFQGIGLIKILFPEAKIIHCQRHPLDICLANYQRLFTTGNYHSYNLEELGQYYLGYYQLMEHWYSIIPNFMYPLQYENLVTNQEEESRKLIQFCGLNWEDNVLNFQENQRSISTASVVQVRQKLYTSSANKWQRYAKHLEPLKQFFEEKGIL